MKQVYDAAVIGCGRMGSTIDDEMGRWPNFVLPYSHAAGYAAHPRTQIVAATDPVEEKRLRFGERYGVPKERLFATSQEMVAQVPLDVVSVTTQLQTMMEIVENFAPSGFHKIVLTKMDEAVKLGLIIDVLSHVNRALSFITTGQEIPKDIEIADPSRLVSLILGEAALA